MYKDPTFMYRTFSPKVIHYGNDGYGRDSYIRGNHGGFMHKTNYHEIALPVETKYKISRKSYSNCDNDMVFSCQKLIPTSTLIKEKLPFLKTTILIKTNDLKHNLLETNYCQKKEEFQKW